MRPLFAIAPLAVVLALLGPTSQASQSDRSWTQALWAWAFEHGNDGTASPDTRPAAPKSLSALMERIAH